MKNIYRNTFLKRFAAALLASLLALSASACHGSGGEIPVGNNGFQKSMHQSLFSPMDLMCETEGGVYFQKDLYLYYLGKVSGDVTVLCGRPDCVHRGVDCNAYISARALWFAGGRLYCVPNGAERKVISLKPDGTGRRTVQELQFAPGAAPSSYTRPICHRGVVYYVLNDVLWSVPLGGDTGDARALWTGAEAKSGGEQGLALTLWADGESVYFMASIKTPAGGRRDTLFAVDAPEGPAREVWATPGEGEVGRWSKTGVSPTAWYVLDGSIYFFLAGNGLWRQSFEGGEPEKLADTTENVPYGAAVFSDAYMAVIQDAIYGGEPGDAFYVYGLDGALERELPLASLYAQTGAVTDCVPLFITGNHLYFALTAGPEGGELHLARASIETGETQELYTWN